MRYAPAPEDNPHLVIEHFVPRDPAPPIDFVEAGDAPPKPQLQIVSLANFAGQQTPERPWLVRDLIPRRQVTMLSGDGGVGKSLLAKQLGIAVVTGTEWVGTMPETGPVLYLGAEDDLDEINRRVDDILTDRDIDRSDIADFHVVVLAGCDAVLAAPEGRNGLIRPTPLFHAVCEKVATFRPRLVIVDNLADAFAGNENSRTEARQFVNLLRKIAIDFDCAVILLSHPSLTGISSGSGTSGSTAWSNSVRSRIYLDRAKGDNGDEPDPNLRLLSIKKVNYAAGGINIRIRWEAGCFRTIEGGAGMFDRIASEAKADAKFMELLKQMQSQGRDVSHKPSSTYAPAVFAKLPTSEGIRTRGFEQAMNRLFERGTIKIEEFGSPSRRRSKLVVAT